MKPFLILLSAIFLIVSSAAFSLPAQAAHIAKKAKPSAADRRVMTAYYGCLKILKMSHKQQLVIAKKTHRSYGTVIGSCKLLQRTGLKQSEYWYRRFLRGDDDDSSGSYGGGETNDPYGGSQGGFAGAGSCSSLGTCVGPGGVTSCSNGTCVGPSGVTSCTNGTCVGPSGVTSCTNGTCVGPGGVTSCTNGTCN